MTEEENKDIEWENVQAPGWNPELAGDFIIGVLIGREPREGKVSAKFFIKNNKNEEILVWGSTKLEALMTSVKDGEIIKINYLGKVISKASGNEMHDYTVQRPKKKEQT